MSRQHHIGLFNNRARFRWFISALVTFICFSISYAQVPNLLNPQRTASLELTRRGITEKELTDKLAEKGVFLDDLQSMTPDEALRFQSVIEQALSELEAEKSGRNLDQFNASDTTVRPPVRKSVLDSSVVSNPAAPIAQKVDSIPYLPAVTTSKTTDTQSSIRANPLDISRLVYGQELFKNKSLQAYNKSENIKPPDTYVLGVGDIVNVHIFGRSKVDFKNLEINAQGYIQPSSFPRIYIKGLTYSQARQVIRQNLSSYFVFQANEFEVTIDYSREIGINIYGEAEQIGTFNMPATNTAFNALVAAGGPNRIGSVRNIKLIRGKTTKKIDVYEFIANPAVAQDLYLEQNDIIYIPVAERVVSITGAVRRPMRYELTSGENLMKLIEFAAGLREDAFKKSIQIRRYVDDIEKIIDVPLKELMDAKDDFTLLSGDVVSIKTIPLPLEAVVIIDGRVETPGTYAFIEGMRISDLLAKGLVRRGAKTDLAFLMRLNDDGTYSVERINVQAVLDDPTSPSNLTLRRQDRLSIYSLSTYIDAAYVSLSGAVRQGVRLAFDPNKTLRISDLIVMGGGLVEDALDFGYIKRINKDNFVERDYILFNSKKAIESPGSADDLLLEPNDELIVYNDRTFFDQTFVTISGSVRRPGTFAYGPGFTLKDIVIQAGGFTMEAATNRIEVFRVVLDENRPTKTVVANLTLNRDVTLNDQQGQYVLKPFDQIQVRTVPDFKLQQNVTIEGEVQFPGTYALIKDNESLVDLFKRAGGPTAEAFIDGATLYRSEDNTGYIVFRMPRALKDPQSEDNLFLKEGDRLTIPKIIDYVRVEGATDVAELYPEKVIGANNRINIAFEPNRNAKYYVDRYAAGVSRDGSRNRIVVEQPNGRIKKTRNFGIFKVYPKIQKGSVVRVGTRDLPRKRVDSNGVAVVRRTKTPVNWSKVLADTMAQATAVLSFILLIQNVK
ncbi:MAG: SLBB domain-containing protein [Saprospiraceae bacterium]|nr:SLBB domain-containing protein [Saprospiraceae bacterium]